MTSVGARSQPGVCKTQTESTPRPASSVGTLPPVLEPVRSSDGEVQRGETKKQASQVRGQAKGGLRQGSWPPGVFPPTPGSTNPDHQRGQKEERVHVEPFEYLLCLILSFRYVCGMQETQANKLLSCLPVMAVPAADPLHPQERLRATLGWCLSQFVREADLSLASGTQRNHPSHEGFKTQKGG